MRRRSVGTGLIWKGNSRVETILRPTGSRGKGEKDQVRELFRRVQSKAELDKVREMLRVRLDLERPGRSRGNWLYKEGSRAFPLYAEAIGSKRSVPSTKSAKASTSSTSNSLRKKTRRTETQGCFKARANAATANENSRRNPAITKALRNH